MQNDGAALTVEVVDDGALPPGDWLAPATAASMLGVSERTLWRLVKAGRYHRRTVDRKALILVPRTGTVPDTGANIPTDPAPSVAVANVSGNVSNVTDTLALAIVDELRRQHTATLVTLAEKDTIISAQAETIGSLRTERDAARASLAAAVETVLEQRAPGVPTASPGEPAATIPPTDAPKSRWHALWPLLTFWTAAALMVVVVGALLFWPR
jgi:hypothetical protein